MKGKKPFSIALGVGFGTITYFAVGQTCERELAFSLAVMAGTGFTLLLFAYLNIHFRKLEKQYAEAEKGILSPVFLKVNGNFDLGHGVKNANIYFCETGIIFISLDEKPYIIEELELEDFERCQYDDAHLNLYSNDGRKYSITTADVRLVLEKLREKDWID